MIDFFTYYYPLGVGICIYVPINRSYKVDDFLTPMIHPTGNYGFTCSTTGRVPQEKRSALIEKFHKAANIHSVPMTLFQKPQTEANQYTIDRGEAHVGTSNKVVARLLAHPIHRLRKPHLALRL